MTAGESIWYFDSNGGLARVDVGQYRPLDDAAGSSSRLPGAPRGRRPYSA